MRRETKNKKKTNKEIEDYLGAKIHTHIYIYTYILCM